MNHFILHGDTQMHSCTECLSRVYADKDKLYEVIVREHDPKRSGEQNRLYWALMQEISRHAKDDDGKQHSAEWWAYKLRVDLGYSDGTIELQAGKMRVEVPYPKSTTKMGIREFSELYSRIETWAAEREIYLQ